jgi:hypothetical protein
MINVRRAMEAEGHGFQVFLSFRNDTDSGRISRIEKQAQSAFGSATVRSIVVENRGADIGQYLHQLQVLGREPPEKHYDMFLKIQTKSSNKLRRECLSSLCGSVENIRKLYTGLRQTKSIGMVGPAGHVWVAPWVVDPHIPKGTRIRKASPHSHEAWWWRQVEVDAMNRTWEIMHPPMSFEKGAWKMARMIADSFYWVRQEAVLNDIILHSVDKLVESMPYGYTKGSCCQTSHALERLMPTIAVTILGLDVVPVEDVFHHLVHPDPPVV